MRRVVFQCVSAVGVMAAAAVLDLGPNASAAYIPVRDVGTSPGLGSGPVDEPPAAPIRPNLHRDRGPTPVGQLQGGGGMTPPGGGSSSSSSPAASTLTRAELPVDGLVVYYREPASSIQLSTFIDSILDPPRRA